MATSYSIFRQPEGTLLVIYLDGNGVPTLLLDYDPEEEVSLSQHGRHLVFTFSNSGQVLLHSLFGPDNNGNPLFKFPEGTALPVNELFVRIDNSQNYMAGSDTDPRQIVYASHEGETGYTPPGARQTIIYSGVVINEGNPTSPWISEGNDNAKHTEDGQYQPVFDPDADWIDPANTSPQGAPLRFSVTPGVGKTGLDGYITRVTLTIPTADDLTTPIGMFVDSAGNLLSDHVDEDGNIYTVKIEDGQCIISVDSSGSYWKPVDLSGYGEIFLVPLDSESDQDMTLEYLIDLEAVNTAGRTLTAVRGGDLLVVVDAVADRPDYMGDGEAAIVIDTLEGDDPDLDPVTEYDNGVASQTIGGGAIGKEYQGVMALGEVQFHDYRDDSEEHFALIACQDPTLTWTLDISLFGTEGYEAFLPPENGVLESFWLYDDNTEAEPGAAGATMYYKVIINDTYLTETNGSLALNLPVVVGANAEGGKYSFDVKIGAREKVHADDFLTNDEFDFDNNLSIIDVSENATVTVLAIKSEIKVSTGWAYESGADAGSALNPDANPNGWGAGSGHTGGVDFISSGQQKGSGAFIKIEFPDAIPGETIGDWITLRYDSSRGEIYLPNGIRVSASAPGGISEVTFERSYYESLFGTDKEVLLYFVPHANSDDDSDFSLTYELYVTLDGRAEPYTISNEIPIVIDAVADAADVALTASGDVPVFDGFTLDYEAVFRHDDSETQYIIIANPDNLLALGELGPLATYLTLVDAAELRAYDNPESAAVRYFDSIGNGDIILRIEDLAALDALDGTQDGKLNLKIPFVLPDRESAGTEIDVSVKTVVVEGGGNDPGRWAGGDPDDIPGEVDFANNIAVTDQTVNVWLSEGEFTVIHVQGPVYEGDRDQQHWYGDADSPEYGTSVHLQLGDPHEAIQEISFSLQTADGSSDAGGSLAFGDIAGYTLIPADGSLRFSSELTGDTACYTKAQIIDAQGHVLGEYTIDPAATLQDINSGGGASGLRFIPSGDSDADVLVEFTARVADVRSGDTVTVGGYLPVIIRDAVADLPTDASSQVVPPVSGHQAVVAGTTIEVEVKATFGDHADGSEAQYLFVSKDFLESVAIPSGQAAFFMILSDTDAARVCAQVDGVYGIPGADSSGYFVIMVAPNYLQSHGGEVDLELEATLRSDVAKDGAAYLDIKAVAVEHKGLLTQTGVDLGSNNIEFSAQNNVSVVDAPAQIEWATLENEFAITVETPAYENNQPDQHVGDASLSPGAVLSIVPADASEVFDTLTIHYLGEDGQTALGEVVLAIGGVSLAIPSGTTLVFTYDATDPALCVKAGYTDSGGEHYLNIPGGLTLADLTAQGLRYVPFVSDNDSDVDVDVTFSGTTRETASGETGVFAQQTVQVVVDAVADKPDGDKTLYDYSQQGVDDNGNPYTAIPDGGPVSFQVQTAFHDYADGSETHYLFFNVKYLADGSFALVDNATGLAFTGGVFVSDPLGLADLFSQLNLDPQTGGDYLVLQLDAAWLQAHGGALDLTINGVLKNYDQLKDISSHKDLLDMDVKAVAVEHKGYDTPTTSAAADGNDEYTASNNVAVTDVGVQFRWDALQNEFTLEPGIAFEGDQPNQHSGNMSPAGGAPLVITPADDTEIFTRMDLEYDNAHGDIILSAHNASGTLTSITLPSGVDIEFTYDTSDPTLIVRVSWSNGPFNSESLDIYAADGSHGLPLQELTAGGLRYVPHADDNDDADVALIIHADTRETATGTESVKTLETTVVVDAVADVPQDASAILAVTDGKGNTITLNEGTGSDSFGLDVKATFSDYSDGSEGHYILVGKDFLSSIEGWPSGIVTLDGTTAANILSDAGLGNDYFVLKVSDAYLQANDGKVDFTLTAHLNADSLPGEDTDILIDVKAGAIEHQGHNTPVDGTDLGVGHGLDEYAENNVSLVDIGVTLQYARLDNEFTLSVGNAFEGDMPDQHTGDMSRAGGAVINIAPQDMSEVFDTLALSYNDSEGTVYFDLPATTGNVRVALPDGAELTFSFRNEGAGATLCTEVTVTTDGTSITYTLANHIPLHELTGGDRLRYIPDTGSQSDADVAVSFTGTMRETATDETGSFSVETLVKVDAVADRPDGSGVAANQDSAYPALACGVPFELTVNVDFGTDIHDDSEAHYIFISKTYLDSVIIPSGLADAAELLSTAEAAVVCNQVDGPGGVPGADPSNYFVIRVAAGYLQNNDGKGGLMLEGALKSLGDLHALGASEDANLSLVIKTVAVEHQGFRTDTTVDLGGGHGHDVSALNNVAVNDASASFTFAVLDNVIKTESGPTYEGDQALQHTGNWTTLAGGGSVTIAPDDPSEVFTELTLTYDNAYGSLILTGTDNTIAALDTGAKLVFVYDPAQPAQCVSVQVWQPGDSAPSATLSFIRAVNGQGMSLEELTSGHLRYVPDTGDHHDADVAINFSGTLLETDSGAQGPTSGFLTVVVDAVADMPVNTEGSASIVDEQGIPRPSVGPGAEFTLNVKAGFADYGEDDAADTSEAHYIFISKEYLADLDDLPGGITLITSPTALDALFASIEKFDGTGGIHAGPGVAGNYYVLEISSQYLQANDGIVDIALKATTTNVTGRHTIAIAAAAVEHGGYLTDVSGIGGGTDRDFTALNNVAVNGASFELAVRGFAPEKIRLEAESEWAFENDRHAGHERYHTPGSNADRDLGVGLSFAEGPGDGNVVSSIILEYGMPSNGSPTPHRIESFVEAEDGSGLVPSSDVTITYDTASVPGKVIVTVTADEFCGSVGELRFIPGDNYDNADVDIKVLEVVVSDPLLGINTQTQQPPGWNSGVVADAPDAHVKIDAVAQMPGIDIEGVDHSSDDPVLAGDEIHITGKVAFEDLKDGSEEHFILFEVQDGYYPDAVTLTYNGVSVTLNLQHYLSDPPAQANYTLQQLITPDDGESHLFCKLPVDAELRTLMNGLDLERMDDIAMDVTYQTREWAAEGAALHFAAASTEDLEMVREYDANWNITNDELPFDKLLEAYIPGYIVEHPNNTAIAIEAQAAYVYWDSNDPDDVSFRDYVFENDRPADHVRNPTLIIEADPYYNDYYHEYSYPVAEELRPNDPITQRNYGTGVELNIPANAAQVTLNATGDNNGEGDFYFLPQSAWKTFVDSHPLDDSAISGYRVTMGQTAYASGSGYILVFIPENEIYNETHTENGGSHKDHDFHFDYEILANQYGPQGEYRGQKRFVGEDEVIRVDAVANQAENLLAGDPESTEKFSLWGGANTTSSFPLTIQFHDLDATEDHYALLEVVVNFGFVCNGYTYTKGDMDKIYTHVETREDGTQTSTRYYKIPVSRDQIDPVTGEVTLEVNYVRLPGSPASADYPRSDLLSYGAMTQDQTSSRWDSLNPNDENFINRIGADAEYSYENNTSVVIRNGMANAEHEDLPAPSPGDDVWSGGGGEIIPGTSTPGIHWPDGPGGGWGGGWIGGGGGSGGYWTPGSAGGGGDWWRPGGGGSVGGGDWGGGSGGGGGYIPGGPSGPGGSHTWPTEPDPKWIASKGQGLTIEWMFENSTPLGHTDIGKYNHGIVPTRIYVDCVDPATGSHNYNAEYFEITIPGVYAPLLESNGGLFSVGAEDHHRRGDVKLFGSNGEISLIMVSDDPATDEITYRVPAPDGYLPEGSALFFMAAPDSLETDFQVQVQWFDKQGLPMSAAPQPVNVLVDAVAQWADFAFEQGDGVFGFTGDEPRVLLNAKLVVNFLDQDGSEGNYVLVERVPGVLPLHVIGQDAGGNDLYGDLQEVSLDGKTYFIFEPTAAELAANEVTLKLSVNADLTSPMYIRDDIEYEGSLFTGMKLAVGTMTVEGSTGEVGNWEYTLKNNTALNLDPEGLTIVISNVNAKGGNSTVMVKETDDPDANIQWLDPADPATALNLSMDGNDVLTSLVFTEIAGNGGFWYVDGSGGHHPVPVGVDIKQAYLDGRIYHKQDRYEDSDAVLRWEARVEDGLSQGAAKTVDGTLTMVVDAVAKADEIHLYFPVLDKDEATLSFDLTFDDHQSNEMHYAVIAPDLLRVVGKEAVVYDATGTANTVQVETIFDPSGKPYYAVCVDGFLDVDGSVKVQFEVHELNISGIEGFPVVCGGVSMEPNTGYHASDREMELADNWAINTRVDFPHQGVVDTKDLVFSIDAVTEDSAEGGLVYLSDGTMGEGDIIASATLALMPQSGMAPFAGEAGTQIATLVYKGQCFAVLLDGTGKAVGSVDFSPEGFDASADFRIIWGIARADGNGEIVVDAYNHAASGTLDLDTSFVVTNSLSGMSKTMVGTDPDGVPLHGAADAGFDIAGDVTAINGQAAAANDPVGAAEDSATVTIQGRFEDIDGSESHYLLIEVPEGWKVVTPLDGFMKIVGGVSYYHMEVDGRDPNPSVDVTLKSPDGLNAAVELKTGAFTVEDNGHEAFAQGDTVTLYLSDVSATGLAVNVAPILEDGLFSLTAMADAALVNADGNDVLASVTFTDLAGGSVVDAAGNAVAQTTFTQTELASGAYFYKPLANYAGQPDASGNPLPVRLEYDALLGETNTGAIHTLTGQGLDITIIPVADAPDTLTGSTDVTDLGPAGEGHKTLLPVRLEASFEDIDGSETHFFIVHLPDGAAVAAGAGYTVNTPTPEELAALAESLPTGGGLYKLLVNDASLGAVALDVMVEITTTVYNGGGLTFVGGSSEPLQDGTLDYGFSGTHTVQLPPALDPEIYNLAPVAQQSDAEMDTWRDPGKTVEDRISMADVDPDGDAVSVDGLSFNGTEAGRGVVDGMGCFIVRGEHGTLYLFDDGAYRYTLDAGAEGTAATEVFDYRLADGYGGMGQSAIIITLTGDNSAPFANPSSGYLDSARHTGAWGNLVYGDSDGDAVSVVSVDGDSTLRNLGTSDNPVWGYEVVGRYGVLQVYEDANGKWKYNYTLDLGYQGVDGDETFVFTVADPYGGLTNSEITIQLENRNTAPQAEDSSVAMDTLRDADGEVAGSVAMSDADGDALQLSAIVGPRGPASWGFDDNNDAAFVVQGEHGMLYLYPAAAGDALDYRYVLTDPAAAGVNATETFTYTVDDGFLGTDSGVITINLTNTNNVPLITGDFLEELATNRLPTGSPGQVSGMLAFADPDYNVDQGRYDQVSLSGIAFGGAQGSPDGLGGFMVNGEHGVFSVKADGTWTYTINPGSAGATGLESFSVTVIDEFGASGSETVSIDLVHVNSDPTASAGSQSLDTWRDNGEVTGALMFTDADGDTVTVNTVTGDGGAGHWGLDPDNAPAFVVQGAHGTLYIHQGGTYLYVLTDPAGTGGSDVFSYTVEDGYGGSAGNTITISLTNANTAPVVSGDLSGLISGSLESYEDGVVRTSGQFTWADPEGDAIASVSVGGVALPASGSVSIDGRYGTLLVSADGSYTYTLNPGVHAQGIDDVDSFEIIASDVYGAALTESLDITLKPLSHSPECDDVNMDWPLSPGGAPASIARGELSFRDADLAYDPTETLQLAVSGHDVSTGGIAVKGLYGTLTVHPNGEFTYTPDDGNLGQPYLETFTYTVTDAAGNSAEAELRLRLSDGAPEFPNTGYSESGLTIEWLFENGTPLGHTDTGKFHNGIVPSRIYVDCVDPVTGSHNYNAEYFEITIPGVYAPLIDLDSPNDAGLRVGPEVHHRLGDVALYGPDGPASLITVAYDPATGERAWRVPAPDGYLPEGTDLFFLASPNCLDTDFQVQVQWFDKQGLPMSAAPLPVDVPVDAVAQWADFAFMQKDGVFDFIGADPRTLLDAMLVVNFLDQDGSESNYVLLEQVSGVLPLHVIGQDANGYDIYGDLGEISLDGKTYFFFEPTATELATNVVIFKLNVNTDLVSPLDMREDIEYEGHLFTGMKLAVGTMTVEGGTGEADKEYTLTNNTALNLDPEGLTIVISNVTAKGGDSGFSTSLDEPDDGGVSTGAENIGELLFGMADILDFSQGKEIDLDALLAAGRSPGALEYTAAMNAPAPRPPLLTDAELERTLEPDAAPEVPGGAMQANGNGAYVANITYEPAVEILEQQAMTAEMLKNICG